MESCEVRISKKGALTVIDADEFERVTRFRWRVHIGGAGRKIRYARGLVNGRWVYLHRFILNLEAGDGVCVDHINGDGLDNRKENLRLSSSQQNIWNAGLSRANTSGFKGVSYSKQHGKWSAYITLNLKHIFLGYFAEPQSAYRAYCEAANRYFGEFANPGDSALNLYLNKPLQNQP